MTRKETLLTLGVAAMAGLIGGSVSTMVMTPGAAKADPEKVVTAQKFELVDADGKERGSFAVSGDGMASLTELSKSGDPRAVLGAGADGLTALSLAHHGNLRAQLKVAAGGTPNFEMWGDNGDPVFQQPK
jgi:hypothetical protein